jgi:hypothetical protein
LQAVLTFNPDGSLQRSRCALFNNQAAIWTENP